MDITIVNPNYEHIPEIARICAIGWKQTVEDTLRESFQEKNVAHWYNHDKVRADINSGSYSHVALIGTVVVGTIGGMLTSAKRGDVFVLYVDERYRYQGIGRRLLSGLTKEQVARGAVEQWVSVEKGNWRGIPFYRSVTGSKTPTSRIRRKLRIVNGGSTASNGPIGSTNNQWGIKNPPLIGASLYEARGFVKQEEQIGRIDTGETHVSLKYKRALV